MGIPAGSEVAACVPDREQRLRVSRRAWKPRQAGGAISAEPCLDLPARQPTSL